jgi:hypothetical protein
VVGAGGAALWPFRLGFDPRREELSEERREELRERARRTGFVRRSPGTIPSEDAENEPEEVDPMDDPSDDPDAFLDEKP